MTEVTGIPEWIREGGAPQPVDPVAFALAFIGGPLLVAVGGCWALVPIIALFFGAPTYVLFGLPLFFLALRRRDASPGDMAVTGIVAHLISLPFVAVLLGEPGRPNKEAVSFLFLLGLIFAPLWGAACGKLYRTFRRDFFTVSQKG